jgi:hypothetical protein
VNVDDSNWKLAEVATTSVEARVHIGIPKVLPRERLWRQVDQKQSSEPCLGAANAGKLPEFRPVL